MKQKFVMLVVALLMTTTSFAQFSGSGSGTKSDPYLIFNPIQLDQMRNFLNQSVYFKLMADIDLEEFITDNYHSQGWLPIGTSSSPFMGVFDGNGKTISNLIINRPSTNYVGFWGYIEGATISNVTITCNVTGGSYTGGLIGCCCFTNNIATISNVTITGNVTGGSCTGGVIGFREGKRGGDTSKEYTARLSNISVTGKITGKDYVGGLVGRDTTCSVVSKLFVNECAVDCFIEGNSYVGGMVGFSLCPTISASSAVVDMFAKGNYCGGIMGYGQRRLGTSSYNIVNISTCNVSGKISGRTYTGGCVGYLNGNGKDYCSILYDNYFHGTIIGLSCVGGVCGGASSYNNIYRNYANAIISGNQYIGGIVGYGGNIKQNVAINSMVNGSSNVGRICSTSSGVIGAIGTSETNKALTTTKLSINGIEQICEDNLQHGQSVGKSVLKYKATYQGIDWNFSNTWAIQETESYPYFVWQVAPPIINDALSGATIVSGKGVEGATIVVTINGQKYQTTCSNNTWSVTTDPLVAGSTIYALAKATGKSPSYIVSSVVDYWGSGSENDPYQIYTAEELANINGSGYYKLMNDIDVSPINPWLPIGQYEAVTAHLDGDNHLISGININTSDNYQGLFAQCDGSTLKNINISVIQLNGGDYTGALVAKITNGAIINCHISGNVSGGKYTGGLVGYAPTTGIAECSVSGNVMGYDILGGLAAYTSGPVSRSRYQGTIRSQTDNAIVGGLIGVNDAVISECYSTGYALCTKTSSIVGGLIGKNTATGQVSNCYSMSEITSVQNAGGLIGRNFGSVENCYAGGNITSMNIAGGLVGYNDNTVAVVHNCCAMNPTINATSSSGIAIRVIGGLANDAPTPAMDNYALKTMAISVNGVAQKIYDDNLNGIAKTEEQLKQYMTYLLIDWDMSDIWSIDEGVGYPYLRYFRAPANSLHLTDGVSVFLAGEYTDGIDYMRVTDATDEFAAFCLPFNVRQGENMESLEALYIPIGIALKYNDAHNGEVLKILFVPTDEIEAGMPFIAKLAAGHNKNLSIVASTNEITQNTEAQSVNIIPYSYDAGAIGSAVAVPVTGQVSWNGTFANLNNQTFYALQPNGNLTYQTNADINPFRAFLKISQMPNIRKVIAIVDSHSVTTSTEEYLEDVHSMDALQKILYNGQLLILRDGKVYNAVGAEVK